MKKDFGLEPSEALEKEPDAGASAGREAHQFVGG